MEILIRQEQKKDWDSVYSVVKAAFEGTEHADGDEQDLVNRLRKSEAFIPELSLVAEWEGKIIGHILFTKLKIGNNEFLALAPVSVLPEYQGQGVGEKLIKAGYLLAKKLGFCSVIVVGHPTYYPRFGYTPASRWNISAPFEVPDNCFMAIELTKDGLKGVSGSVEYPQEFFEKT